MFKTFRRVHRIIECEQDEIQCTAYYVLRGLISHQRFFHASATDALHDRQTKGEDLPKHILVQVCEVMLDQAVQRPEQLQLHQLVASSVRLDKLATDLQISPV